MAHFRKQAQNQNKLILEYFTESRPITTFQIQLLWVVRDDFKKKWYEMVLVCL